jgi:hypothetical protein
MPSFPSASRSEYWPRTITACSANPSCVSFLPAFAYKISSKEKPCSEPRSFCSSSLVGWYWVAIPEAPHKMSARPVGRARRSARAQTWQARYRVQPPALRETFRNPSQSLRKTNPKQRKISTVTKVLRLLDSNRTHIFKLERLHG